MQDHRRSIDTNRAMEAAGIRAASWVVGKALSLLSGGVLEAWAASTKLGSNIEDLKTELLHAQGILGEAQGKEIHNPALAELLNKLRHVAYRADDALDELDYFRIQDDLDGTYHAAQAHAAGCVQDLTLNARHVARDCVNKLKFPMCSRAARCDDPDEQEDGGKKGCLSRLRFCGGRHEIGSSLQPPASQLGVQEVQRGCMPKAVHNVGKHFSCFSLLPPYVKHNSPTGTDGNTNTTRQNEPLQTPKLKFDRVEMSRNLLDITKQLNLVCARVSSILSVVLLNSRHTPMEDIATNRPKATSLIIEPKLYGRDKHKQTVVDEIVNGECCELTVLPIVGPGGIGKTTLTQHIYEQMKSRFQVSIWICVSQDFNANGLARDIVKKIPEVNNENKNCSDEELIEQRLKGKRVLLVLDDVWPHREDDWKKIIALLKKEGAKGNMVIVTTRILEVANTVKTTECSLHLERLCPEDITSFFEESVFGHQEPWVDHLELSDVGSKIVEKLKGSPLAAKTVGRLLKNKLTLKHWRSVLENKEWESEKDVNDIMPALKLSYDYLPFPLQQCFSFCGLFPEDYEFGSEELVYLWIGLDILQSCDQKKKMDVGLSYLNDLVNHGFFKMNENEGKRPYYNIHDLLHELAVKVSSYHCLSIYSSNAREMRIPQSLCHLSVIIQDTDVQDRVSFQDYCGNLSALDKRLKVEQLRTLILFGDYHGSLAKTFGGLFREATALRVIFLSGVAYNLKVVLHNFSKLVHLRYLRIKPLDYWNLCLPSALFRLYHLEVLDLQSVGHFASSTRNMCNLVKLQHFLVPENMVHLHSDIFAVGKLKFFHELKEFRVGKERKGFELSQLGQLTEIEGSLGIYNLENVQTKEEANELKLIHKNHIRELVLEWDVKRSNTDPVKEEIVLESLVPHTDLQKLDIKGHGGTNCPSWLCTNLVVKCLKSLCLDSVSWKNLPPLGEMWMVNGLDEEYQGCCIPPSTFHNLKRLQLSNISRLKKWVGNGACPFFSHLEVLIVRDCSELVELPFTNPTCYEAEGEEKMAWFPRLQELRIENCPKLTSVPPIPWGNGVARSAKIVRVGSGIKELGYPSKYRSNLSLEIEGEDGQGDALLWNCLRFSNLTNIEYLYLRNIPPLPLAHFHVLTSVKFISIDRCDWSGKELTRLLSFLPNLSTLLISNCDNITGLGVAEHVKTASGEQQQQQTGGEEEIITAAAAAQGLLLLPPHLQELTIIDCKRITLFCNPPHDDQSETAAGEGLQRLRSLSYLQVYDCPEFLSSYSSPSSSFSPFPTCLQQLYLTGVKHMETLRALSNLTSLTKLSLEGLEGSRDEGLWPLLAHGRLTNLTLDHLPDFFAGSDPSRPHDRELFSCSSKLLYLHTGNNTGFLAAPICSLFSSTLTRLDLWFTGEVERFTKEQEEALQLLISLQELQFIWGDKLHRLPAGLHKLTNLQKLGILRCVAIRSLPSLPSSLRELEIVWCPAFQSLPNTLPSSLEILKIFMCKAIKLLPKDGLPSSMRQLDVHGETSEELKRACRKLIGTIPIIRA